MKPYIFKVRAFSIAVIFNLAQTLILYYLHDHLGVKVINGANVPPGFGTAVAILFLAMLGFSIKLAIEACIEQEVEYKVESTRNE